MTAPPSYQCAVISLAMLITIITGCDQTPPAPTTQVVHIGGRAFELELALDTESRYQGLSNRAEIAPGGGMLFVFAQSRKLDFVMRDCLVSIDIIFLDPGGRVVRMHAMQPEPAETPEAELTRYSSRYKAQFSIELRGGTLAELGLNEGDRIVLPLDELKRHAR